MPKGLMLKRPYSDEQHDVKFFVMKGLADDSYNGGELETLKSEVNKLQNTLANLINTLTEKDQLTKNDIYEIVLGYVPKKD